MKSVIRCVVGSYLLVLLSLGGTEEDGCGR
jgi:hypothetical protein